MKHTFPAILVLAELCVCPAHAQRVVAAFSFWHGTDTYQSVLTPEMWDTMPNWTPDSAPFPPLAPQRALEAARSALTAAIPGTEAWSLDRISLMPLHPPERAEKWMYEVSFSHPVSDLPFPTTEARIIVLLSGHALKPEKEVVRKEDGPLNHAPHGTAGSREDATPSVP
jgi:hypothetical protein